MMMYAMVAIGWMFLGVMGISMERDSYRRTFLFVMVIGMLLGPISLAASIGEMIRYKIYGK